MSILNGYGKYKRYILTSSGYKLCSQWTSSNTVHFDDNKTAQTKLGAIDGITDSLTATSSNVALSAKAGKSLQDQVTELNTGTIYLGTIDHVLTDSEIGNIAKIYSIPDFKAYIAVMLPIVEEPFLQAGGSHVVFGMEYGIHKWGFQMSFGYLIKHRILSNGVWGGWKNVTMS